MTARELQKSVVEDLKKLFEHDLYKTPHDTMEPLHFFPQFLPKRRSEDDDDPFSYVIVRVDSGGIDAPTDPHKIALLLVIGIYDDSEQNNGHEAVLEIIERIQQHYEETPVLGAFSFTDPFGWALQDEESWPYYYGAVNVTFNAPAPRTKWSELI